MAALLWGTILLPLLGFLLLSLFGRRFPPALAAGIGVGSVGFSAVFSGLLLLAFLSARLELPFSHTLLGWISAGSLRLSFSLYLDGLSLLMSLVVSWIGFFIHLFSVRFMEGEERYRTYFAYLNLFVAAMLLLLLADNLLLLFLGWELVGLCSYLLIGFWYREPENGRAARKAFIVTRVGDAAFSLALALLFAHLGSLGVQELAARAAASWPRGSGLAVAVAALLLVGALGKSAQIPLQVWLPDAMAGPTPVSALIHAATMVTAGVYLVARTHALFELAPAVLALASGLGAATLLVAALSALAQTDLKRTLAYSTISQIGYMFLALGAGAWSAAIFHLFTHAFLKALLFLGAGAIMHATGGEHDMRKLGGLARRLPLVFFCFLAGAASLSSIPLVTSEFYSKGWILEQLWSSAHPVLWAAGLAGAFLTGLYSFRMVVLVFLGETRTGAERSGARYRGAARRPAFGMSLAMVVLAAGALLAGFLQTPTWLGDRRLFSALLASSFPAVEAATHEPILPEVVASLAAIAGAGLAFLLYPRGKARLAAEPTPLARFLASGFGFDRVYDRLFVRPYGALTALLGRDWVHDFYKFLFIRPYTWLTALNKDDVVDLLVLGIQRLNLGMHRLLAAPQKGRLRWYLLGISVGAALILGMEVFL